MALVSVWKYRVPFVAIAVICLAHTGKTLLCFPPRAPLFFFFCSACKFALRELAQPCAGLPTALDLFCASCVSLLGLRERTVEGKQKVKRWRFYSQRADGFALRWRDQKCAVCSGLQLSACARQQDRRFDFGERLRSIRHDQLRLGLQFLHLVVCAFLVQWFAFMTSLPCR